MIVLITGVSGGLGQVLARTLLDKGVTVYGTMRDTAGREQDFPCPILPLEATNEASVQQCIDTVVKREGRIDAVINCVNQMFIGSVEEATVEEVEQLYRTNVFGVLRICRAVLPQMRAQGGGTIINMSSLGGLIPVPYMSAYTSAKFALEAMSESMYREVKDDNIRVVIMQPVAMFMERSATGAHLRLVDNVNDDSISRRLLDKMTADTAASKLTPEMVAEKIYATLKQGNPPLRVPMDKAKAIGVIKRLAPQSVMDKLVSGLLK